VTGATGYVGGRLVPLLLKAGYKVRAAGRSLDKIRARQWGNHPNLEPVYLNMHDFESIRIAAQGCFGAYYLIHSMSQRKKDFAKRDLEAAKNMAKAAELAGLERIIYLGGLGEKYERLSKHLFSRAEVSRILNEGKVPVTVLRAAMILGAGSASFEILRYIVEHLPVIFTPKFVHTRCQPICIRNVLHYLVGCLGSKEVVGRK
ncbi:MAG: NAD(P)H-binding protein, partial [bacterium]|nr:NAD(P)H-binding protein [bacterium]